MKPPRAITMVMISVALALSLMGEWAVARSAAGSILVPPLATLAVILAMAVLPFSLGLWCALAAGFVFDSVALPPFGASIVLFVFLACVIEIARLVIADRIAPLTKAALAAGLVVLAGIAAPVIRAAMAFLHL